jgi:hypothetical protein
VFAGRDASRGLATMSLGPPKEGWDDISDLNDEEREIMADWADKFSEKYPVRCAWCCWVACAESDESRAKRKRVGVWVRERSWATSRHASGAVVAVQQHFNLLTQRLPQRRDTRYSCCATSSEQLVWLPSQPDSCAHYTLFLRSQGKACASSR